MFMQGLIWGFLSYALAVLRLLNSCSKNALSIKQIQGPVVAVSLLKKFTGKTHVLHNIQDLEDNIDQIFNTLMDR